MNAVLVDANVLLDILNDDPDWAFWSDKALRAVAAATSLVINPIIYAEISVEFDTIEQLEATLPTYAWRREFIPFDAGFLAGKAFIKYKKRGGTKRSPLPDFFIGAHAAVAGYTLLTRDATRYRSYFPTVKLIAPE